MCIYIDTHTYYTYKRDPLLSPLLCLIFLCSPVAFYIMHNYFLFLPMSIKLLVVRDFTCRLYGRYRQCLENDSFVDSTT